ncbi:MAG: helix-turn-helix domain-containing protein [Simkaniaceae bacterium]|nr:helix-turn-helix domain-containing protein [Simkaniaceae bacterium]
MASAIGEGQGIVWLKNGGEGTDVRKTKYAKKSCGTVTWLRKVPGGPPLRFGPLPKGVRQQRKLTEQERSAVVDYALEVRKTKSFKKCAGEMGLTAAAVSNYVRTECKTYRTFLHLGLDDQVLLRADYRELLADLRAEKNPIRIKYSDRNGLRGVELVRVRAREHTCYGHPYFVSVGEGEQRVFTEEQKQRAVTYWLHEFMGGSISECARECNLSVQTLAGWTKVMGKHGVKRTCPDTKELPGSSPKGLASDPVEDPLPGISWRDVKRLCGDRSPSSLDS